MSATPNPSPLNGKYLARNPLLLGALQVVDAYTSVRFPRRALAEISIPKRILLANSAHLGDVLVASSLFPTLKAYKPDIEIGCVVGSWAAHIVKAHPLVTHVHIIDHWKQIRARLSPLEKYRRYRQTSHSAMTDIRAVNYDVAVDLYSFFPNFAPLLRSAEIPVRIGYTSGGFGNFYTHAIDWTLRDAHILDYHFSLLQCLPNFTVEHFSKRQVMLQSNKHLPDDLAGQRYIILHIGAGHPKKNWSLDYWRELATRFIANGYTIVFTGAGNSDNEKIQSVITTLRNSVNLCNRLSWQEFICVIERASLLIGVDTVATHIADAVGTPSVTLYTGIQNPHWWKPTHANSASLSHPVPCAPCYKTNGCETMECIKSVSVEDVYAKAVQFLSRSQPSLNIQNT